MALLLATVPAAVLLETIGVARWAASALLRARSSAVRRASVFLGGLVGQGVDQHAVGVQAEFQALEWRRAATEW